jgi:hypothetical protein
MLATIKVRRRFRRERRTVTAGAYGCSLCHLTAAYPYRSTDGALVCSLACRKVADRLAEITALTA